MLYYSAFFIGLMFVIINWCERHGTHNYGQGYTVGGFIWFVTLIVWAVNHLRITIVP